ncbi:MAG: hypothetical protein ACI9VM_000176 [Candidatus Azotimanducaceae bacterium]|jgi:hypothetical protein
MKKLPKKYAGVYIGAILSTLMGVIMSFFVTFLNIGFTDDFLSRWGVAFIGAWPVGFTLAIIITPFVKSFVDRITTD